jgi:hypothetical protein
VLDMKTIFKSVSVLMLSAVLAAACGDDDEADDANSRPEDTGAACASADQCYPDVAEGELQGDALCLDRVRDGYCTHSCEADADCCAAEGECETGLHQVCSPFESTGDMMCFLSCEAEDIDAAGDFADENEYCQRKASRDFACRSSGGGSDNRKICVPANCGVGADCADTADCTGDLECLTNFQGGYCTVKDCALNADCPQGSLCIQGSGGSSYCAKSCDVASDCSLCRASNAAGSCSDDVQFAEDGTTGSVCVPP